MNDVGLHHPVVDETSHNVEDAVDHGINDPSTDKCKGPIVGDEPCLPIGDVALNVSSSKIDDVDVNASKITDVEREVVLSGGDDARGVPLSSGRNVGNKVADEDAGAAGILDAKSPGVGIAGNENVPDCEDFPPENFPLGGLDYGDALQDASSMEEELLSSSNPDGPESGNVVKVDTFFFAVTRLRTNRMKCHKPMFQNKECDASVGSIAKAFVPTGMLNLDSADVLLYFLCQKYRDTNKLIVPRWVTLLFPTFDPPSFVATMKPSEESGHWCLIGLNLRFRRFECLDSLRDETWGDAVRFLRNMTDNIKKLWRESSVDRAKPFSPVHIDGFSCEFVRVPQVDYSHEDILDIRKTLLYTCATSDVFDVDFRGLFGIKPCECLDLGEHDYRFFGSQFLKLERCYEGVVGSSERFYGCLCREPYYTQESHCDSDDDVFDKIASVGRVTRSAAAKGLSPLAGIVARRAGGARKDPALDSGNVVSTKRAPRAPIKFCSPMQQLHPHKFPHLDKARRLYNLLLSDEWREKYAENTFSMIPQPDESVTSFTRNRIWEVFTPGQMMEGDVMDFLIDDWKQDPERNADFASGKRILLSPYFITVVLDCSFYGDENKVFNVESAPRDFKSYVKDKEDLLSADLISRLVQVMKAMYGDAQYNVSKQPN
ncbi:unnamed protein product [Triticum turgidum subsp. durum]|uniref:Ubiquitin-like protease family profile domain-containing protein n=1 Tax=Triticum turgidum subsp. durum TaxID=4567 RepID=A0A9R1BBF7_TRITD|nr:unnamed protein product [Triticum turgidum subsp. durum]